jgi:uncharacterized transporter YbjL
MDNKDSDDNNNMPEINLNNINNIEINSNDDEYLFTIPINEHSDFYATIEAMIENLKNSNVINVNNEENLIEFDIEFEYVNNEEDTENNYFKNCKEINENICKSEKIKENDELVGNTCLICHEDFKVGEFKRKLPANCNHIYHKKCIDKWLKKKSSCPVCRYEFIK